MRCTSGADAFVPAPLPPVIEPSWRLTLLLDSATGALRELSGLSRNLPNPELLWGAFARREAVLSSRIEGTQSSLSDLVLFEVADAQTTSVDDAREVANYRAALDLGLEMLKEPPLTLRVIASIHERLMRGVRGDRERPDEWRTAQNRIGPPESTIDQATYVPPPVLEMKEALYELERLVNEDRSLPLLVRPAISHYQFEAIHPFRDGNGRVGRLLVTLMLCAEGALHSPLLYLSGFFEEHRVKYYDLLLAVSQRGAWTDWIEFFLRGVHAQAKDAIRRSDELLSYQRNWRAILPEGRASTHLLRLFDELLVLPATTVQSAADRLGLSYAGAQPHVERLVEAGVLTEVTGRQRRRVYLAAEVLRILQEPERA